MRLTAAEIEHFNTKGFVGPFDAVEPEALVPLRETFHKIMAKPMSPIYDIVTHRDWHLHYRNLLTMVYRPQVIDRLASLLGPNLLVWRSSIFHKAPGDGRLGWHQSSLFAGEEYGLFKPAVLPPENYEIYTDLFNVSAWFALDDVTSENGAMQIACGTHNKQYPVRKIPFFESEFGKVFHDNLTRAGATKRLAELSQRFACETQFDPQEEKGDIATISMKAGQFFIFTDRVMHGSLPNVTSGDRRLAINFRITIPEVDVYPHRHHGDMVDGNDHCVDKHACVMLCGSDVHGKNVYLN
jgi:non-heme Fe2+,alpha-ketoglutarate-dependent halogenase